MAILITGISGFVGRNLQSYLIKYSKEEISDLDLRTRWLEKIKTDTNTIVHLAGKAHDLLNSSHPDEYYKINFDLTCKVYDAFLKSNAKCFIFVSSVKAVADRIEGTLDETITPHPETHYGKSKLMAEEYIMQQPLPKGKNFYILRPCMIHGPGNKGNLNLLYRFIQRGIPYPLAAFDNKRSFLSVENLCFVIKEIISSNKVPSGIYHIADDEALSTNELITLLARSLGKNPKLWIISKSIIRKLAWIGDKLRLPLNSERLNKLTENYIVSNEKIKKVLLLELPIQSSEGIIITANSFNNG
ncbi:MAG TPA: NAD-dependent epimerase/dehydratase family protein [Pedobacter sp.]|uniref:NAD-dependent epimerase/dehydratase family protein n=1 Tax=Pedobacter sp. TaxID=1411316 RepID=UPI002BD438AD|nr:NAD-dependent epimerase/dehydratase family protein [Pedobacter sp.]HMI00863.1 NAD-dependent epimerase/dehydratase family protein [Pedobacter sp.]